MRKDINLSITLVSI